MIATSHRSPFASPFRRDSVSTLVTYFVLPNEDFGALVRWITITNIGADALTLCPLDGLAKIQPYGGKIGRGLKFQSRVIEA